MRGLAFLSLFLVLGLVLTIPIMSVHASPDTLTLRPNADGTYLQFGGFGKPLSDSFNDNSISAQWNTIIVSTATIAEANARAECSSTGFDANSLSGYVSAVAYDLTSCDISIDVTVLSTAEEMDLLICLTKVTTSTPWGEANGYRIIKYNSNDNYYVQRRVSGSSTTLANGAWSSATGTLRIIISSGTITFYENGNNRFSESYALSSYNCYIYFFRKQGSGDSGTDAFDNFVGTAHSSVTSDQSDTTGVQVIASTTQKETLNLADHTTETGTINSVTAYSRVKASVITDTSVFIWRTHSTDYETTVPFALTTSFAEYSEARTTNPNTSSAWTWAEVDALELGSRTPTNAATNIVQFSEYWVVVDHSAGGTNYTVGVSLSATLAKSVGVAWGSLAGVSESLALSDAAGVKWGSLVGAARSISLSQSVGVAWGAVVGLSESLGLSKMVSLSWSAVVGLSNGLGFSSSVDVLKGFAVGLSQGLALAVGVAVGWLANAFPSLNPVFSWVVSVSGATGVDYASRGFVFATVLFGCFIVVPIFIIGSAVLRRH